VNADRDGALGSALVRTRGLRDRLISARSSPGLLLVLLLLMWRPPPAQPPLVVLIRTRLPSGSRSWISHPYGGSSAVLTHVPCPSYPVSQAHRYLEGGRSRSSRTTGGVVLRRLSARASFGTRIRPPHRARGGHDLAVVTTSGTARSRLAARCGRVSGRDTRVRIAARAGASESAASWAMPGGSGGSVQLRLCVADRDRPPEAVRPPQSILGAGIPHRLRPAAAHVRTACRRAYQAMHGTPEARSPVWPQ
jgi:hypothetical protein